MGTRGRRSAASLSVVPTGGVVVVHRPGPPSDLTQEQAHEWRAIVSRMPADWFPRETHGLLAAYCQHITELASIAQLINQVKATEPLDVAAYDRLLKVRERESRAASSLATRMRITQQSTYDEKKKKPLTLDVPWGQEQEPGGHRVD